MEPSRIVAVASLVAAVTLAGCLGAEQGLAGTEDPRTEDRAVNDGVEMAASVDRGSVPRNGTLDVRFRATNVGDEGVRYREGCWEEWSLEIVAVDGDRRYRYPQVTCQGFQQKTLRPGGSHTASFQMSPSDWTSDGAVPTGTYRLDAGFTFHDGDRQDVTATLRIDVTGG